VLNLIRERVLDIANRVRLLLFDKDSHIVEKMLVTVPERFETTITTLENIKDLSRITLAELLNSLQAQKQRRAMRESVTVEEALPAKHEGGWRNKGSKNKQNQQKNGEVFAQNNNKIQRESSKRNYPPCKHCNKLGHPPFKCRLSAGEDLMLSAASAINLGMKQSFVETKVSNKM